MRIAREERIPRGILTPVIREVEFSKYDRR
jgi:hypothetical protein